MNPCAGELPRVDGRSPTVRFAVLTARSLNLHSTASLHTSQQQTLYVECARGQAPDTLSHSRNAHYREHAVIYREAHDALAVAHLVDAVRIIVIRRARVAGQSSQDRSSVLAHDLA